MPLPRFQRLSPDKRAQLLDVASKEFAERGFEVASLNEILARAGLGKSSYYYYFSDKEDLYATVIEDLWHRVEQENPLPSFEVLNAAHFWPAIEAWLRASIQVGARYPEILVFVRDLQVIWREPPPRLQPLVARTRQASRALLERGRALGCVRTDIDLDWLISIVEAADRAIDERMMEARAVSLKDIERHTEVVLDTLRRLVEPRVPSPPPKPKPGGGRVRRPSR